MQSIIQYYEHLSVELKALFRHQLNFIVYNKICVVFGNRVPSVCVEQPIALEIAQDF